MQQRPSQFTLWTGFLMGGVCLTALLGAIWLIPKLEVATFQDSLRRKNRLSPKEEAEKDAFLAYSNLQKADLKEANFEGAILLATDLTDAVNLEASQLETQTSAYLYKVNVSEDIQIDSDRDGEKILDILKEKHPKLLEVYEELVEAYRLSEEV